jgi:acetoacetyl-CoA synthetase
MATPITEGMLLWEPSEQVKEQANIRRYMQWLEREKGLHFTTPQELWAWSVDKLEDFWVSLWDYFHIKASKPYETVLVERKMPEAQWFPGAQLNYTEHVFRNATNSRPAALFKSETQPLTEISWDELYQQVRNVAAALRGMGVQRGDRVVAYMPNIPQSLVAFLATASIGAIWSSCSPDFGTRSVIDRFQQIEPTILFAVDGYQYGGKIIDRRAIINELQQELPTLRKTIVVSNVFNEADIDINAYRDAILWHDIPASTADLTYEQVPFDHPLWVLYSSGTTGLPKAIVQGQGGILLEHMKSLHIGMDMKEDDRFFWFTTTGWMMWNLLVGGLLLGIPVLMYDGSPAYPNMNALWQFAEQSGMTFFGTSAGYILGCMKAEITPGKTFNLSRLRGLGSTGSPLPPEGFQWIYDQIKHDLWLASYSGGTDVCSGFLGGCVLLPVYAGELQCRSLGARVEAFDDHGNALTDEVGELVITEPMPSMPLFFWNDPQGKRYRESYFEMYPGIWRHGDWVKITSRGSAIIYGRSDSTINRKGIRMGSSEIYRIVEDTPEVLDSLIIGIERPGGAYYMPLFVVLKPGVALDDDLKARIRARIRANLSPHHVPDEIIAIPEVPRTLSGKKLEVPVKKLFMGIPLEKVISIDSMSNPQVMQYFIEFARSH